MHKFLIFTASLASLFGASMSQYINPDDVSASDRAAWCLNQQAACPLICTQETDGSAGTYANDCDADTLVYDCVCSNGLAPNVSEYSQTVPFYVCQWSNNICVQNCGSDNACASSCNEDHPCGAQNPTKANASETSTASASSTPTSDANSTEVYNGFGSSATASSGNGNTNGASSLIINVGQIYGLGMVAAGIFAGFSILL